MKEIGTLTYLLKGVVMVCLCSGTGCNSPKAFTGSGGVKRTMQTIHVAGVKGLGTSIVRYPVSGSIRAAQQGTTLVGSWLNPGMGGLAKGNHREHLPPAGTHVGMDVAVFETLLDRQIKPQRATGKVSLLIDGPEYFSRLGQLFREARDPVDVQLYIFDRDDFAVQMADALKQTSQHAPVRVLYDDLGSLQAGYTAPETPPPAEFEPPEDIARYLKKDSSIRVRKLHNVALTSTHTKIITFSASLAHIGGMNIGREYLSEWHDLMAEVQGPVVELLQAEVDHSWKRASPVGDWQHLWPFRRNDHRSRVSAPPSVEGTYDIRVFRTKPFDYEIQEAIHLAIDNARQRVWIENPYFTDDTIVRKLIEARRRGVDVRIVLPIDANAKVLSKNNEATAAVMFAHGIRIFVYPRMTHVKAGLFDDWAFIGSANYDRLSLRVNDEVNIAYSHPAAVRELEQRLFLKDFRTSKERRSPPPTDGVDHLAETAADAL
ncbi:phosphatidylserine/phosphatidylglycerophosphate/cardiolipin synthase-like enzyme [Roseimicrobium gellanilyticum]|uniref:Phosphatidylserine/phosphatidylglycerophosphate/ cardiolipin synthase-like enzyme n=1 Tax=Roseimicrobium gellanilyticum TaxID=748857 RepID=A0A366HNS4_9BACT|nr:phosphatidylserine/phosphatidylglycerophosphate/cardiolipin synthase family protein [Roseimicrobium gellanilyticum]RBP45011.1 phosphatidylserine/phosphatidylglycerophosphate/cardiolipin synthase-like enzyme [Roseimicrobium gellanilyticum]